MKSHQQPAAKKSQEAGESESEHILLQLKTVKLMIELMVMTARLLRML